MATTAAAYSPPAAYPRRSVAWYALGVLTLCYTFSYVDRQILAFLVGPLKQDMHISDTEIGLLQGLAFAAFYAFFGLPMGMLADRFSRRNIVLAGLVAWSVMTALSGAARNYWELALARMGVGVGEAVINPCALSMIADYFPKERLSLALSVYMMGIQLGAGLAMIIGGIVAQTVASMPPIEIAGYGAVAPWRLTFVIVGVPGLLIALILATVKEPARRSGPATSATGAPLGDETPTVRVAFMEILVRWRSVLGLAVMIGCQALSNYALLAWGPTFFERVHGWPRSQTGLALGTIALASGCIGLFLGGRLADSWQRKGITDATLRVGVISLLGVGTLLPLAMLWPTASATVATLAVGVLFVGLPIGCCYAGVQFIFPNRVRGLATAVVILIVNLMGLGLGSLLPGVFTDYLFANEQKVGNSIALTIALSSAVGLVAVLLTLRPYRRDYALLHSDAVMR
ncbi:MAG TPA: MFS transporter [Gammaproteobacteria bacterium]|nr:MFS transporter [Gammaproteobacteria bacterium]